MKYKANYKAKMKISSKMRNIIALDPVVVGPLFMYVQQTLNVGHNGQMLRFVATMWIQTKNNRIYNMKLLKSNIL